MSLSRAIRITGVRQTPSGYATGLGGLYGIGRKAACKCIWLVRWLAGLLVCVGVFAGFGLLGEAKLPGEKGLTDR